MSYKKRGGIHWLAIGRLRISWCVARPAPVPRELMPFDLTTWPYFARNYVNGMQRAYA